MSVTYVKDDKFRRLLEQLDPRIRDSVASNYLTGVVIEASADAKEKQIHPPAPRSVPPRPKKLTSRSPGRGLVAGIGYDTRGLPRWASIGADKLYAVFHERGLGRFPRRWFLRPAKDKILAKRSHIIYRDALRKAGGG